MRRALVVRPRQQMLCLTMDKPVRKIKYMDRELRLSRDLAARKHNHEETMQFRHVTLDFDARWPFSGSIIRKS